MLTIKSIIEVIGFPAEHVDKTMLNVLEKLKKEDGIKIVNKQIYNAKQVKQFFSSFVELELDIDNLTRVIHFCMDYHPSSIEIEDRGEIKVNTQEINNALNDLIATLHKYNMITKSQEAQLIKLKKEKSSTSSHSS